MTSSLLSPDHLPAHHPKDFGTVILTFSQHPVSSLKLKGLKRFSQDLGIRGEDHKSFQAAWLLVLQSNHTISGAAMPTLLYTTVRMSSVI